jgi:hypothetical protein
MLPAPAFSLGMYLHAQCSANFVSAIVRTTPRRRNLQERRLSLALPAALLGVRWLVARRRKDMGIDSRIRRIVTSDDDLKAYLETAYQRGWNVRNSALVVGLLARAFRGAVGHRRLFNRPPADLLRKHLYGHHAGTLIDHILLMKRDDPEGFEDLTRWWQETYLGRPGAAARFFQLLPS